MARKNSEGAVFFHCPNEECGNADEPIRVEGRWNAIGEFEPAFEDDLECEYCGETLVFENGENY